MTSAEILSEAKDDIAEPGRETSSEKQPGIPK
jgi:hypothetical protein